MPLQIYTSNLKNRYVGFAKVIWFNACKRFHIHNIETSNSWIKRLICLWVLCLKNILFASTITIAGTDMIGLWTAHYLLEDLSEQQNLESITLQIIETRESNYTLTTTNSCCYSPISLSIKQELATVDQYSETLWNQWQAQQKKYFSEYDGQAIRDYLLQSLRDTTKKNSPTSINIIFLKDINIESLYLDEEGYCRGLILSTGKILPSDFTFLCLGRGNANILASHGFNIPLQPICNMQTKDCSADGLPIIDLHHPCIGNLFVLNPSLYLSPLQTLALGKLASLHTQRQYGLKVSPTQKTSLSHFRLKRFE